MAKKQYSVTFITKKGGEEDHEMLTMADNAKEAVSIAKELWYSENTMHAFRMHATPVLEPETKSEETEKPDDEPETEQATSPEQPEDVEPVPETETAETTPEQPMAKAFGVRRLEKIIFNCIILHMENSAEIISALKSDIKKYGIEEVFHYRKISVSNDFVIEKIRVFVPFDDETDLIHLELEVRNLFLKNSRMVVISDKLAGKMLDFGFYDINFTLTGTHKTLPCDYVIEKERPDYTPETIPAEEPEQPEDVETVPENASADEPETTTDTEKQDCERCSDCVHYPECDKKYTPDSVSCLQYMKRRYHIRE